MKKKPKRLDIVGSPGSWLSSWAATCATRSLPLSSSFFLYIRKTPGHTKYTAPLLVCHSR